MTKEEYIQAVAAVRTRIVTWAARALGATAYAEDVTQEVLLRLWMMHERLAGSDEMARLASVMTRNLCKNRLRDTLRHATIGIESARNVTAAPADTLLMEEENSRRLQRAATSISDRYRTILYMRNTEGLSYSDIAAMLDTTESSVRGMMSKARRALIQQLKTT